MRETLKSNSNATAASAALDPVVLDRLLELLNQAFFPTGRVFLKSTELGNFVQQQNDFPQ